jgi:hypothetical protein
MLHALRQTRVLLFLAIAALVYSVSLVLVASLPRLKHPDAVAAGVFADITIVVPLAFFLIVSRGRNRCRGLTPVFLASLAGAAFVLPAQYRAALPLLRLLAVPAELAAVGLLLLGIRRGLSGAASGDDVLERLERSLSQSLPNPRLARAIAYEISVLYYGLFSWRQRVPMGTVRSFSYHRTGGYGAVVFLVIMISAVEIVSVHLLVARFSTTAAWVLTGLGLYAVLWILGDFQAVRLRPLIVDDEVLRVRLGLRWSLDIPFKLIDSVRPVTNPPPPKRSAGHLQVALLTRPQILLDLREPLKAVGPYGLEKDVRTVAIAVDDLQGLRLALRQRNLIH